MVSYDYNAQKWITGDNAKTERIRQLQEEREIIADSRGAEYLRFTGSKDSVVVALAKIDAELKKLS